MSFKYLKSQIEKLAKFKVNRKIFNVVFNFGQAVNSIKPNTEKRITTTFKEKQN